MENSTIKLLHLSQYITRTLLLTVNQTSGTVIVQVIKSCHSSPRMSHTFVQSICYIFYLCGHRHVNAFVPNFNNHTSNHSRVNLKNCWHENISINTWNSNSALSRLQISYNRRTRIPHYNPSIIFIRTRFI